MITTPSDATSGRPTGSDHLDPDILVEVALALGADPSKGLRHLEGCGRCAASLEAVARLRAADAADAPDPARAAALADGVIRELGLDPGTSGAPPGAVPEGESPDATPSAPGPRTGWTRWAGLAGAGLAAGVAAFASVLVLASAGGWGPGGLPPALAAAALAALHPLAEELVGRGTRTRPARGR